MVELIRLESHIDRGTVGVIMVDGRVICYTLELPWKDNTRNLSCIPDGEYNISLEYSNKYGLDLWELKDVPGRSEIKIHPGNYLRDILGCVLVGSGIGYDGEGNRAVLNSRKAFKKFMAAMINRVGDTLSVRSV